VRKDIFYFTMSFTLTTIKNEANSPVCITPKSRMHGVLFFLVLDVLNIWCLAIGHAYRDVWYASYCMSKRTKPSFFFLFLVKEQSFPCCRISQAYTGHTCRVTPRARSFLPLLLTRTRKHNPIPPLSCQKQKKPSLYYFNPYSSA